MNTFYGEHVPTKDEITKTASKQLVNRVLGFIGVILLGFVVWMLNSALFNPEQSPSGGNVVLFYGGALLIGILAGKFLPKLGDKISDAFRAGRDWQGTATKQLADTLAVSPTLVEITSMLERELGFPTPKHSMVNYAVAHSVIRQLNGNSAPRVFFQQGKNEYVTLFKIHRVNDSDDYAMSVTVEGTKTVQ